MPSFLNQQVNPPKLWEEFEDLCADLWGRIWNDDNTHKNGRSGQAQHGVDVYGRIGGDGDWAGVQCKGKDGRYGGAVTEKELRAEVEKAKNFKPLLKEFILATTAQDDAEIQRVAREITQKHEDKGLFRVEVFGWNEIHRRLADHSDLIEKHYEGQGPGLNRVEATLETFLERQFVAEERRDNLQRDVAKEAASETGARFEALLVSAGLLSDSGEASGSAVDEAVNAEIDGYRDLLVKHQPATALRLLEQLKARQWNTASDLTRFRILTNIASAHLALGDKNRASSGFLEAEPYAPQDDKAACNAVMAFILVGEDSKAKAAAQKAIKAHPDSDRAYALLVASSISDDSVDNPEVLVPEKQLKSSDVAYALSHFYRQRENWEQATKWMMYAYELDDDDIEIRGGYALTLLEGVTEDQSVTLGEQLNKSQEEALTTAAEILHQLWDEFKNTEVAPHKIETAFNLSAAERLRGNFDKALEVVDSALRTSPESFDLKRQKAGIHLEANNPEKACETLASVNDSEFLKTAIVYAEALAQSGSFPEALEQIERYLGEETDKRGLAIAAGLRLRLLKNAKSDKAALEAVEETLANHPEDIFVRVTAATVLNECGDSDRANKEFRAAKELITPETEFGAKLVLADALYHSNDYEEAASVYGDLVKTFRNSQPLRRLLVCLFESDRRTEALGLLNKIPQEVRELSFFRRMAAAIYVRIGEFDPALLEIDAYLSVEPNDLNVRLNWIGILLRQGEKETVETFLADATDFPEAAPEDRIHLAQLFDRFGHIQKALDLAYLVLMENPGNSRVHLGYMGLLMFGTAGDNLNAPNEVAVGTAFFIEDAAGNRISYFISEATTSEPKKGEILLGHPIADSALGMKVGDTITIEKNPYQKDNFQIVEIKSKYLHALHISMAEFSVRFPSDHSFMTVSLASPEGEGYSFDPIFQSLSDQQDYALETLEKYKSEPYPIGVIAKLLGKHPIDIWRGFQADQKIRVFCCDGNGPERQQAMNLINSNRRGFVVDPLTLDNIYSLGVQEPITATVGKLGITESCLDLFHELIGDRRMQASKGGSKQVVKDGEQYIWYEFTEQEIEADIRKLEEFCEWASKNCEILSAVGKQEPPMLARKFAAMMHPAFTDCILAANGAGRLLLSDDQRLRLYSKELWDVDGVWIQTVLMEALRNRKLMSIERYSEVTASLIEAGIQYTTIDRLVLLQTAKSERWEVTDKFKAVVAIIGSKKAELHSSLQVAASFLSDLWHNSLPLRQRENLTFAVINAISANHGNSMSALLNALIQAGNEFSALERSGYLSAIKNWCTGHFITFPPDVR